MHAKVCVKKPLINSKKQTGYNRILVITHLLFALYVWVNLAAVMASVNSWTEPHHSYESPLRSVRWNLTIKCKCDQGMILGHLQWLITLSLLWVTKTEFLLRISSKQVMGIKKTIYKEIVSWSNTKFSIQILQNLDKKDCNFLAW